VDALMRRPVPDSEHAECEACLNEATASSPVLRVRVQDLDGEVFTRLHGICLTGLLAHGAVDLDTHDTEAA
jgi:hypothetical protein